MNLRMRHIALLFVLCSAAKNAESQTMTASPPPDRDEAVLSLLQRTLVDADYNRIDLEKVIQDLRDRYKLNIHVSWSVLEAAGIRRDQRIEVQLQQVPLATVLDMILREARGVGPEVQPLSYFVDHGVIVISNRRASRENTVLRTYEVADLMESGYAIRRFANTPVLAMALTGREFIGGEERTSTGGSIIKGGSGFGGGGGEPQRATNMERIQMVIDLITECVDHEGWETNGGDVGSMRTFGSTLLISNTVPNHQHIAEFLDLLRSSRPQPLDVDAMVIHVRSDKALQWRQDVGAGFPRLNAEQTAKLLTAHAAETVLFHGTCSGFSGEGIWFSALTQRDVLSGAKATVAADVNAFEPTTSTATAGLELIVLPLLVPKADDLTLDVQMAWVPPTQVEPRPVTLSPAAANSTIDQTTRSMRTVSSTTKLKLGDALALSIPAQLSDQAASAEWQDWLVVHVHKPGS